MARAYLLIGGNLGEREKVQKQALDAIASECGEFFVRSSLYESAPWGFDHDRHFLNRVVGVETSLSPRTLLECILGIEDRFGRERKKEGVYQGRTLDIDILYYEDRIVREEGLKIPHPHIPDRRFTLLPLAEIAPQGMDPLREKSMEGMLRDCSDPNPVKVFEKGWITST